MKTPIDPTLRARLSAFAQQHPEWRFWLALCEATMNAVADPVWTTLELRPGSERPTEAPLLEGMQLVIEKSPVQAWLRHLSAVMERELGESVAWSPATLSGMGLFALLETAIQQDVTRLQALADTAHADTQTLQTLAQLAVTPLLHACRYRLADRFPHAWAHGYCPYCGAWAVLAERRGLARTRHLRCGRCGGEWRTDWLRCPFCSETHHERLAFLVPEGKGETQSVATCTSCQGYIKTLATLQGAAPQAVMLDDLATVALDVVAVERGYARPRQPGYSVNLHLVERTPSWSSFLRRFT